MVPAKCGYAHFLTDCEKLCPWAAVYVQHIFDHILRTPNPVINTLTQPALQPFSLLTKQKISGVCCLSQQADS